MGPLEGEYIHGRSHKAAFYGLSDSICRRAHKGDIDTKPMVPNDLREDEIKPEPHGAKGFKTLAPESGS